MKLTLYSNNEDKRKISKTVASGTEVNFTARADFNILNPIIILTTVDATQYNYAYIDAVNRYYFIDKIENIRNGVYKLFLSVDVLKTYELSIKSLSAEIVESENPNEDFLNCEMSDNEVTSEIALTDVFDHSGKMYFATVYGGN